jgi:UDP-2,3-diacylglucosamine pyrophosphatase LpxH
MKTFVSLFDLHYGYQRDSYRHKKPLHDLKAMDVALQFVSDFKPDHLVLGGDILDCGVISHHNRNKPGRTEGFRLRDDARELRTNFLDPLEAANKKAKRYYITGNHEDWLEDMVDENPGYEGYTNLDRVLSLGAAWKVVPQGGHVNLGKLTFLHGDQLRGGEHVAKAAVVAYERSVRFGHFHTYQTYTKTSALDIKQGRTGIVVPCLCSKDPKYGEGAPNRWVQGLNFGWIHRDGSYTDYVAIIVNGRTVINGKEYKG